MGVFAYPLGTPTYYICSPNVKSHDHENPSSKSHFSPKIRFSPKMGFFGWRVKLIEAQLFHKFDKRKIPHHFFKSNQVVQVAAKKIPSRWPMFENNVPRNNLICHFFGFGGIFHRNGPLSRVRNHFFEFRLPKSENIDHGAPIYRFLAHLGHSKVFFQIRKNRPFWVIFGRNRLPGAEGGRPLFETLIRVLEYTRRFQNTHYPSFHNF